MKKWKKDTVRVFSKHPTHDELLRNAIKIPKGKSAVIRLGSTRRINYTPDLEINTVASIINTSNKIRMKRLFREANIKSPEFYEFSGNNVVYKGETISFQQFIDKDLSYPLIAKLERRSRGQGMRKLDDRDALIAFYNSKIKDKQRGNPYYLEVFKNYLREYRLHISRTGGCFYALRKSLLSEHKGKENNWYRNDSNCTWYIRGGDNHHKFREPETFGQIEQECIKALNILGLDIGGFDVRVSTSGEFTIIEGNSACSFGNVTATRYISEIEKMLSNV
jgi:D-alanine-D-alanine ligase-like ATP-grasp enzyme